MGGAGQADGDGVLQAQKPADDEGAVRPRARAGSHEAVAAGLGGEAVAAVLGDAGGHVAHVALVGLAAIHVGAVLRLGRGCRFCVIG